MSLSKNRLAELIEGARLKLAAATDAAVKEAVASGLSEKSASEIVEKATSFSLPKSSDGWEWNEEQLEAIGLAVQGKSFNLIGAAGTGKTTTEKEIVTQMVAQAKVPNIDISTKYLKYGTPGILCTSFTRRAVRNMRRVVPAALEAHCITLHKVLEYEPNFYDVWDQEAQKMRSTMRFEPMRNSKNKLPSTLKLIIIDESSMVSTELFLQLIAALPDPSKVQFIFVGDLHQLPPVYGTAILGFKLLELKTVELTRIYRQAKLSPIINLAHRIKNGEDIPVAEKGGRICEETIQGKVTIHPWKKPLKDFDAAHTAGIFLKRLVTESDYNEEEDIILCPQEKVKNLAFGTNEFNRIIAQELGQKRKAVVWEILAGYEKHYYAVGDRVLVGREDAVITRIAKNARYWGKRIKPQSEHLDRWGNYQQAVKEDSGEPWTDKDVDDHLASFELKDLKDVDEDRKQEASHIIDVELLDTGGKETLSGAGDINAMQFAYCLTVHKSQGSEWNRVFFLTHQSHVMMWNRELLYTAATRARKELYMIVEPDRGVGNHVKHGTLTKAARSPRIKGDTLAEKAEYFKGKEGEYQNKLDKVMNEEQGETTEGIYKGPKDTPIPALPVAPKPVKLIRLCEFVPASIKETMQKKLDEVWGRAEMVWGAQRIGEKPKIDYNLQRSGTIGLASYGDNTMYLNPLWCILAAENEKIMKDMTEDTIPHELAHFINHRYSTPKGKGHDGGWVMAAKLLGMKNPKETTSEYPDWAAQYKEFAMNKLQELKTNRGDGAILDLSIDALPQGEVEQ